MFVENIIHSAPGKSRTIIPDGRVTYPRRESNLSNTCCQAKELPQVASSNGPAEAKEIGNNLRA